MKTIILAVLIATALAVVIGVATYASGPGYVVFSFLEYTFETSFIFTVSVIACAFFVFYYVVRLFSHLLRIPCYLSSGHSSRKNERSKNALNKGLIEMSEGRFEQAEKILIKHAEMSDMPLLNYLMAARSAQQLAAYERRDEYLRLAHESTPSADIAIGLTQAELQLSHQQLEQALATLNHLSNVAPKHGYVKKLQAYTYQQLGDWESLVSALPVIRKLKVVTEDELEQLEVISFTGLIKATIKQVDGDKTEKIWQQLPRNLRFNAELTMLYARYLHALHRDDEVESLIRNYLSNSWSDELVNLYSDLNVANNKKQLETAEVWLHSHSRNANLLLALGKLCLKCEFWGKAKSYLETSIGLQPMAETYLVLAQLLEEKMDEREEAQKLYRLGLHSTVAGNGKAKKTDAYSKVEKQQKPYLTIT